MRLRISIRGRVRPSVPCYFRPTTKDVFEGEKSLNEIKINDTVSDDDVVASDVPLQYLSLL